MERHIHPGFIQALITFEQVLAFAVVWHMIAYMFSDTHFGQAMIIAL